MAMEIDDSYHMSLGTLSNSFSLRIKENLRQLLESKHLYQSIKIEYQDLIDGLEGSASFVRDITEEFIERTNWEWEPFDPAAQRMVHPTSDSPRTIHFKVPDVKLFCEVCGRIEAFNVVAADDFLTHRHFGVSINTTDDKTIQVFVFSLQCQSCKSEPEVFLVRRHGMKLTISGRAPIEHVTVPKVIPRDLHRFYSGAIVAHQSGQTLAGIFLLRTLIEQWARQKVGNDKLKADDILDKYMDTLPDDFRERFASMRDLYGKLSADIHSAAGSVKLFEDASGKIVEHFEARKLFHL